MKYSKFFKSIPLEHFVEYNPPLSKKWSPIDHQNDFFEESDISNQITSKGQEESLQEGSFGCNVKEWVPFEFLTFGSLHSGLKAQKVLIE